MSKILKININNIKRQKFKKIKDVYKLLKFDKVVLAGGALRSLIDLKEKVADYDVYFLGEKEDVFSKDGIREKVSWYLQQLGFEKIFECKNEQLRTFRWDKTKIQLITLKDCVYESPEDIIDSFDINACRFALYKDVLYLSKYSINDVIKKKVSLHKITYPVSTMRRIFKYKNKGYNVFEATKSFVLTVNASSYEQEQLDLEYLD